MVECGPIALGGLHIRDRSAPNVLFGRVPAVSNVSNGSNGADISNPTAEIWKEPNILVTRCHLTNKGSRETQSMLIIGYGNFHCPRSNAP